MAGAARDIVDAIIYIVPTESDIIDGEICIVDPGVCFWEDDYEEKIEYYKRASTEHLIDILEGREEFLEFDAVLHVLYERKPRKAIKLGKTMLLECDGDDKWEGAWTISDLLDFVGNHDYRYALEYLRKNIDTMEYPVLEAALGCMLGYDKFIDQNLLQKITKRYNSFTEEDREYVSCYRLVREYLNKQEHRRKLRKFSRKNRLREILR